LYHTFARIRLRGGALRTDRCDLFPAGASADSLMRMLTPRHGLAFLAITAGLLACSACASRSPEIRVLPPRPAPAAAAAAPADEVAPAAVSYVDAAGLQVARTAESLLGLPYREGGALPDGFDCSGFVNYVFARHGIAVPRDVRRQALVGAAVAPGDIAPGDLVFFSTTGSGPTHVGIAIGGGRFIHAPKSGDVVRAESLSADYWTSRFVGARRIPVPGV
jgi:cell wall-associated NlpC family hydrolase